MPRERIHWEVLDQTRRLLPAQNPFLPILAKHWSTAAIGAVLPDAPYYLQRGKNERGTAVAEFLHGTNGEDTFQPLRVWAKRISSLSADAQPSSWALWCGVLSHCIADQIIHPLIYWFTGDYYAADSSERTRARARHRLLEVYTDALVTSPLLPTSIYRLYRSASSQLDSALPALIGAIEESSGIPNQDDLWRRSLREISLSQRLFLSPICGAMMRLTCGLQNNPSWDEIDALFSFGRRCAPKALHEELTFRNPVSGSETSATLHSLCAEAAAMTAKELELAASALTSSAPAGTLLSPRGGTSLSLGLWGVTCKDARFFSKTGLPIRGLSL